MEYYWILSFFSLCFWFYLLCPLCYHERVGGPPGKSFWLTDCSISPVDLRKEGPSVSNPPWPRSWVRGECLKISPSPGKPNRQIQNLGFWEEQTFVFGSFQHLPQRLVAAIMSKIPWWDLAGTSQRGCWDYLNKLLWHPRNAHLQKVNRLILLSHL